MFAKEEELEMEVVVEVVEVVEVEEALPTLAV
jgi:hypothetical protein